MFESLISFLIGLLSGIISSLAVWRYSSYLRAKFSISNVVLEAEDARGHVYYIGIRNKGKREIVNIRVNCFLLKEDKIIIGQETSAERLEVKTPELLALRPYTIENDPWKITDNFKFTMITGSRDLKKELSDGKRIEFQISATDAMSGMTRVESHTLTEKHILPNNREKEFYDSFM